MTKHMAMRIRLQNLIGANKQRVSKLWTNREFDDIPLRERGVINALEGQNIALQAILDGDTP
jgi:hypothetical protein